jgi:hypothetical protein
MPDFNVRSDSVNVEQIMEQIRARIREKRGADYTEQQIQELAAVKLEKFLDPRGVRSDLLEQFRKAQPPYSPPELPNYAFEDVTLFESHRLPLRLIRKILRPILKLFFNPNPLIQALNIQSRLNTMYAEREARREAARHAFDQLHYEVMHNLVLETTRLGIEVKNLKMQVESLTSRLEFNERRARALESVVVYTPSAEDRIEPVPARETRVEEPAHVKTEAARPPVPGGQQAQPEGPGQRSRRRRRRRGRRGGGGSAAAMMGNVAGASTTGQAGQGSPAEGGQEPRFTAENNDETDQADHRETADLGPDSVGEPDAGGSEPDDHEQ